MRRKQTGLRLLVLVAAVALGSGLPMTSAAAPSQLKILLVALDRDSIGNAYGLQSLYTADGNGANIRRITPPSGLYYDWAVWALNASKIVFTARVGVEDGIRENIYMMDPDGTNVIPLTGNDWRNGQPKVSPDGRSIIFTSAWDEFPRVALYRLDLATLQVENLSSRSSTVGGADSDPKVSADGEQILYVSNRNEHGTDEPTQVYLMKPDGTGRHRVTQDHWFNTDPSLSPDGRYVAISSYRGKGRPAVEDATNKFHDLHLYSWNLVVHDVKTDSEKVLTQGQDCTKREFFKPCTPTEGPAWIPRWTPDGKQIGYLSIRGPDRSGLYVMNADGSNAKPVIEVRDKAITWFDWAEQGAAPPTDILASIGHAVPQSALLFSAKSFTVAKIDPEQIAPQVFISTPDRWESLEVVSSRHDLAPDQVRWGPDRQQILFTARTPVDLPAAPSSTVPLLERVAHFPTNFGVEDDNPPPDADLAEQQIFAMASDGSNVRQLTTPRTEDSLDAIPDGEVRGNVDGDLSPDGRFLVFTNLSGSTGESWLLRQDQTTGAVLNLSAISRGPFDAGLDARPRFSPDGARIAFMSLVVDTTQICLMDADGYGVQQITDDAYFNIDPAWSPDGHWLVYTSYRGSASPLADATVSGGGQSRLRPQDWYLIKVNVDTREQIQVTQNPDQVGLRPVWSPDGQQIAYLSFGDSLQPDIYIVGKDGADPRPLQVTLKSKESSFDWR